MVIVGFTAINIRVGLSAYDYQRTCIRLVVYKQALNIELNNKKINNNKP